MSRERTPEQSKVECNYKGSWGPARTEGKGEMGAFWGKSGKKSTGEQKGKKPEEQDKDATFRIIIRDKECSQDPNSGLEHEMWVANSTSVQDMVHAWRTKHLMTK